MANPFSVLEAASKLSARDSEVAAQIEANDRAEQASESAPSAPATPRATDFEGAMKTGRVEDGVRTFGAPMQSVPRPEVSAESRRRSIEAAQAEQVERLNAASQRRAQSTDEAN